MPKFKRSNGIYYARIKHPDGVWRPHTLNTTDPKVADVRYRDLERRTVDPAYRAANETTVGDAITLFRQSRIVKGCAAGTMHMYKIKCAHLSRLLGKDLSLVHLEPPEGAERVDKYIATRLEEEASRNTIGKELTALRGILRTAKRVGKYTGDLEAVLPAEWSNDYEPRRTALTVAQVADLVARLAARRVWTDSLGRTYEREAGEELRLNHAALVAFIVATGARWSEALRATRGQIDMQRGLVYFEITKTRKKGKREKHVPVTPLTRPLLEQVLAATASRSGDQLFEPWANVGRDLTAACASIEGMPRVTPNDLRRTHANWLRERGVDTASIADVLGHVDSRMVEKVYGKLRPEQLRDRVLSHVH